MDLEALQEAMEPKRYIGRAASQVTRYLESVIQPVLEENQQDLGLQAKIEV